MAKVLSVQEFLNKANNTPVIDVRSPAEFAEGHMQNALNLPLFSNEERAQVGTLYKQKGKQEAVLKGLDIIGPKMSSLAKEAQKHAQNGPLLVHCWRGGMRSESMAWLFERLGIECYLLEGGYKAYRQYLKTQMAVSAKIYIIGGMTGSGKTEILHALKAAGEQIIDLEGLANHKGSAFGSFGQDPQPPNELFENQVGEAWLELDRSKPIWIEDESKSIGRNWIPEELFRQMRQAPVIKIELPQEYRVKRLVEDYATFSKKYLIEAIEKIRKRLGGQHANAAIKAIEENCYEEAVRISLKYYDKTYQFGLSKRNLIQIHELNLPDNNAENNAKKIIAFTKSLK
jgi:tRNA 2-selenouridine synthase